MDTLVSTGELLREVARLHIQLQRACVEYCNGTTVTQCSVLTELGRSGGAMTLAELSRRLQLDKGWISRAVEQMAQEGLIEKLPGEIDRRVVQLSLTADGRQRLSELNGSLNGLVEQVMEHVPQKDHASIHHALTLLLGALREETERVAAAPSASSSC